MREVDLETTEFSRQWVQGWIENVYRGIDTVVIHYRNQNGGLVNEVLRFGGDGRVIEGHGTYLVPGPADPA